MDPAGRHLRKRMPEELSERRAFGIYLWPLWRLWRTHSYACDGWILDWRLRINWWGISRNRDDWCNGATLPDVLEMMRLPLGFAFDRITGTPNNIRPREYKEWKFQKCSLAAIMQKIAEWQMKESLRKTYLRRPDLLESMNFQKKKRSYWSKLRKKGDVKWERTFKSRRNKKFSKGDQKTIRESRNGATL